MMCMCVHVRVVYLYVWCACIVCIMRACVWICVCAFVCGVLVCVVSACSCVCVCGGHAYMMCVHVFCVHVWCVYANMCMYVYVCQYGHTWKPEVVIRVSSLVPSLTESGVCCFCVSG